MIPFLTIVVRRSYFPSRTCLITQLQRMSASDDAVSVNVNHNLTNREEEEYAEVARAPSSGSLNLDITTMIAYVSALTNGHADYDFEESEAILSKQASWERLRPVKPYLDELFTGKKLICCHAAYSGIVDIISTLGGPGEKARFQALMDKVQIVPDQLSCQFTRLRTSGKITERSKVVFGTGDYFQVMTLSANSGFVRAARNQGINVAVILHEARALSEGKMRIREDT